MSRPRLLDLFCCAGGAAVGYHQAGFDVVGVDIKRRANYPFQMIEANVLDLSVDFIRTFDAVHASPPCQANTAMKTMYNARKHVDLIPETRAKLNETGLLYTIENVPGAPLISPVRFCGSMFGLGANGAQLRRHRDFETNWLLMSPGTCQHTTPTIGIYGEGCRDSRRKHDKTIPEYTVVDGREAMEMPWATLAELCEAIPPAYTRYIGRQMLALIDAGKPKMKRNSTKGNENAYWSNSWMTK